MRDITVDELRDRLDRNDRPFLLDVRQPEEFAAYKIDGSILIPLGELPQRLGELKKGDDIVVVCKSGGRSAYACQFLMAQGFTNVANLIGGNDLWHATA